MSPTTAILSRFLNSSLLVSKQVQQNLIPYDGELSLIHSFYQPADADLWMAKLMTELDWQQEDIIIAGKPVRVPRLMCWYGEPEAVYRYSGVSHTPLPFTQSLTLIRQQIQNYCSHHFNSVLANLYRDGADSMGWHADKEKELGVNPAIASLSFGDQRLFKIRHNKTKETLNLELQHGDLLLMSGPLQHHWHHCLPKTRKPKQARINLTFRQIIST